MSTAQAKSTFPPPSCTDGGDVVIVGAGLSGLFTALKLAPMPVTVISSAPFGNGTSSGWAQGGIAAAVSEGDSARKHAADTIRAGSGIVDADMARRLAEDAPARIEDLLRYGISFDKDLEGRLKLSREAAHSERRIVRVRGDLAGKAIMSAITVAARCAPSIRIIEGYAAHRLTVANGKVVGVDLWPADSLGQGEPVRLAARAVVLASGGIGQLYRTTTNPKGARGGGLAMAARAGAAIVDAEFVQFHPTALDIGRDPAPLATEALRGEGASLINGRGERFMLQVHEDAELAPRDVVARAVFRETQCGRGAFLDCREAIGRRFAEAFPGINEVCRDAGIDPARDPLPITPAAHYHMGGIHTDADGRTTIEGLWACGEVACTGAHGANRLASNSLLETVVFGARIAEDLSGLLPGRPVLAPSRLPREETARSFDRDAAAAQIGRLRRTMAACVGVVRNRAGLTAALGEIDTLERNDGAPLELRNMALAAKFVTVAALAREESRGAHFRGDYPEAKPALARRRFMAIHDMEAIASEAIEAEVPCSSALNATMVS